MDKQKKLQQKLGYTFKNCSFLEQALTHRSFGKNNFERLEFLGDAVLNLIIAEELFNNENTLDPGNMSMLRVQFVKGDNLALIAKDLSIYKYLNLGNGEEQSKNKISKKILEDSLEAIIGAIYLDAGFDICKKFIIREFKLKEIYKKIQNIDHKYSSFRSKVNELSQQYKFDLIYKTIDEHGPGHNKIFTLAAVSEKLGIHITKQGKNKKQIEEKLSEELLAIIPNAIENN